MKLEHFKTSDTGLAAFLKLKNYMIDDMIPSDSQKVTFVFKDVNRNDIRDYYAQKQLVEPIEYASKIRNLTQSAKRIIQETRKY